MKLNTVIHFAAFAAAGLAHAVTPTDGVNMNATNTVPNGSNSIAGGSSNTVSGSSIAMGDSNTASLSSLAIGYDVDATNMSLGFGYENSIFGSGTEFNFVGGWYNSIESSGESMVMGQGNIMERQFSSAILGTGNSLLFPSGTAGGSNILLGQMNTVDATGFTSSLQNCIMLGTSNQSATDLAWVIGFGNIAQRETVTLGKYAATVSNASLIVGNGTSPSARSNGLVVLKNGNASLQGGLTLGGSPAVTTSYLGSNNYVTKEFGTGADAATNAIIAFGTNADADGTNSIAIGSDANAYGTGAVAFGTSANAYQSGGVAIGYQAGAVGEEAVAIGSSTANGDYAVTTNYSYADGDLGLAMGGGWATADASVALGGYDWNYPLSGNMVLGGSGAAIGGVQNQAIGFASFASGNWSYAVSAYSVAMGSLNLAPSGSQNSWVETDALFELGNGYEARSGSTPSTSNRSNAITTLKNGNTTLSNKAWKAYVAVNTDPEDALDDPSSTTDSGGEALVVEGHTRLKGKVVIEVPQGDISMGIYD